MWYLVVVVEAEVVFALDFKGWWGISGEALGGAA
jgi:hypothetical protein